jgi:hypothetical protein
MKILNAILFVLLGASIGFNIHQYIQNETANENEARMRLVNNNMILQHEYEVRMAAKIDSIRH